MSEIKKEQSDSEKSKISRRDFLKLTGALAGAAGVAILRHVLHLEAKRAQDRNGVC
jgi:hypothetical protein